jgi:hypothetical protein
MRPLAEPAQERAFLRDLGDRREQAKMAWNEFVLRHIDGQDSGKSAEQPGTVHKRVDRFSSLRLVRWWKSHLLRKLSVTSTN